MAGLAGGDGVDKDYEFFMKADIDPYLGQWIAICHQRIVAHGTDVKKVFNDAKALFPKYDPLMVRLPDKETMIL
jgi:hypothetical protein